MSCIQHLIVFITCENIIKIWKKAFKQDSLSLKISSSNIIAIHYALQNHSSESHLVLIRHLARSRGLLVRHHRRGIQPGRPAVRQCVRKTAQCRRCEQSPSNSAVFLNNKVSKTLQHRYRADIVNSDTFLSLFR